MPEIYKCIFHDEITVHMDLRKAELGEEVYRHYAHTITHFDTYLYRTGHDRKELPENIIGEWIKEIIVGVSVNTADQYVYHIKELLNYLINCGYHCFIPKNVIARDTYIAHIYSEEELEKTFVLIDSFKGPYAVKNVYIENELPMLLRLLLCCGLRVGEALNIKVGNIDFQRNLIIRQVTKK